MADAVGGRALGLRQREQTITAKHPVVERRKRQKPHPVQILVRLISLYDESGLRVRSATLRLRPCVRKRANREAGLCSQAQSLDYSFAFERSLGFLYS